MKPPCLAFFILKVEAQKNMNILLVAKFLCMEVRRTPLKNLIL